MLVNALGVAAACSGSSDVRDFPSAASSSASGSGGEGGVGGAGGTPSSSSSGGGGQDLTVAVGAGGGGSEEGCRIATLGEPGPTKSSDIFKTWLANAGPMGKVDDLGDVVLTAALLAPYRMLVVQNAWPLHAFSAEEVAVVKAWVEAGGGMLTLAGYDGYPGSMDNANTLLAPFGLTYGKVLVLYGGGTTVPVTTWKMPHPVTKGITKIGVDNGFEVLGGGTVIGSENGIVALRAVDAGKGHVLAWADEWITFDTEWAEHPEYQVHQFWQNIVDWFAPGSGCVVPDDPK